MAQTAGWLAKAGLSRFALRFAAEGFSDEQFLGLKPADYARFGLEAAADRLKMDRLVRSLRPAEERGTSSARQCVGDCEEAPQWLADASLQPRRRPSACCAPP